MLRKIGFLSILIFILNSCGKIIYTADYPGNCSLIAVNKINIFSQSENIPSQCSLVSDFDYRESRSLEFKYVKDKLEKIAMDKSANIVKINEFHIGDNRTKGASARILGSIYCYEDSLKIVDHMDSLNNSDFIDRSTTAVLYIYRSDWGLPSLIDLDVFVNGEFAGRFDKRDYKRIVLKNEGETTISNENSSNNKLSLYAKYGHKYYVRVSQATSSNATPNSLFVEIGADEFKIIGELQGKIEYDQVRFSMKKEK